MYRTILVSVFPTMWTLIWVEDTFKCRDKRAKSSAEKGVLSEFLKYVSERDGSIRKSAHWTMCTQYAH